MNKKQGSDVSNKVILEAVTSLSEDVVSLSKEFLLFSKGFVSLRTEVATHGQELGAMKKDIATLKNGITTLKKGFISLGGRQEAIAVTVLPMGDQVYAIEKDVREMRKQIVGLVDKSEKDKKEILAEFRAFDRAIETDTKKIGDHERRITRLEAKYT